MTSQEKIELISLLQKQIASLNGSYSAEEKSIVRRVLSEEEWKLLNDNEKQSRRKASISLGEKWSHENDIRKGGYSYSESVVIIYDLIISTLNKLESIENQLDTDLLRVKVYFLIEKDFINERSAIHSIRHLPLELFDNLATTLDQKYPDLELNKFQSIYSDMYEKWPNRPKPMI